MNALKNFKFKTNNVRLILDDKNEPWWLAKDVAEILEYRDTEAMTRRLEVDEVQIRQIVGFGNRGVNVISESGLYNAIIGSQKLNAKPFKKWITSEVLPSIRKTGGYELPKNDDEILYKAFHILDNRNKQLQEENVSLSAKIETDRPKVAFAEALSASDKSMLIRNFVKFLCQNGKPTGEKRFYQYLRDRGYLMTCDSSRNMPTQKAMDLKLFEVNTHAIIRPDGMPLIAHTSKLTPKGQQYFLERL